MLTIDDDDDDNDVPPTTIATAAASGTTDTRGRPVVEVDDDTTRDDVRPPRTGHSHRITSREQQRTPPPQQQQQSQKKRKGKRKWIRLVGIALASAGPGGMISVGYMDPGNWSTDLAAGSKFGYRLLFVVLFSNLIAILLQSLCIRLGLVTGRNLAQQCRKSFHPAVNIGLWLLAELSIIATDLAEVIGTAIALNLLFGLPIPWGVAITGLDVLLVLLGWDERYFRYYEVLILLLVLGVGTCFAILIERVRPNWGDAFKGYIPSSAIVSDAEALLVSLGILGATVMPHNLYLHSAIVQHRSPEAMEKREIERREKKMRKEASKETSTMPKVTTETSSQEPPFLTTHEPSDLTLTDTLQQRTTTPSPIPELRSSGSSSINNLLPFAAIPRPIHLRKELKRCLLHANVDSTISLTYAFIVNSFILIVASAAFYATGVSDVASIEDAYSLMDSSLGRSAATAFAVGLFFSGQCSTITGTLAGQIVMEGFLTDENGAKTAWGARLSNFSARNPWARRLFSRVLAILPALIVSLVLGKDGVSRLLVLSQVTLSALLPFAVWPLVWFTSRKVVMTARFVGDERKVDVEHDDDGDDVLDPANPAHESEVAVEAGHDAAHVSDNYANSVPLTILSTSVAVLMTGLNVYLLTRPDTYAP